MGQRFTDYCASNITPQMTLLEKLNAIITFLKNYDEEQTHLYLHKYSFTLGTLSFVSTLKNELTLEQINNLFSKTSRNQVVLNPVVNFGVLSENVESNVVLIKKVQVDLNISYDFYYIKGVNEIDKLNVSSIVSREITSL